MKGNKLLQRSIRTFFQNWGAYVSLVIVINLLLGIVVVPIMQYMTGLILQVNRIPYLSYTNAVWLLTQRPLAVMELFILLLVIFAMVFWQFAFLLSGINNIALKQNLSLWGVFKIAIHDMRGLRLGSFLFFIGYFILVLPFSVAYLNSPLLSKATIKLTIWKRIR